VGPSYLLVSATNIVSHGASPASLIVGANGWLNLEGTTVDLTRSGLEVVPVHVEYVGSTSATNTFTPDIAVFDKEAFQGGFTPTSPLNSAGLWDGATAASQPPPNAGTAFSMFSPVADSYVAALPPVTTTTITLTNFTGSITNVTGSNFITVTFSTNWVKEAVFALCPAGSTIQVGFSGGTLRTLGALETTEVSNAVTALYEPAYVFIRDTLSSSTNRLLSTNVIGCPRIGSRPATYLVDRTPTSPGSAGGNGYPPPGFFTSLGLINTNIGSDAVTNASVSSGAYADYSAYFDYVVSRPPAIAAGTVSNMTGRINVNAQNLDMTRVRMQANGLIDLQAVELNSSSNAVVNCDTLNLDLNSTNGNVNVKSLVPDNVVRFVGQAYAWSAFWTNVDVVVFTNNYVFSNIVTTTTVGTNTTTTSNTVAFLAPLSVTNYITFHTMLFDATGVGNFDVPVYVYNFSTHSTNAVLTDNMSAVESFVVSGQSLTLQGNLTFSGIYPANPVTLLVPPVTPLQNWTYSNAPNLLYFTNHGTFSIYNEAHFGDDRPTPYSTFVNTGTVSAASIQINSSYFQNNGALVASGPLFMMGGAGKLENGSSTSGGVTEFLANSVKFNNYQLSSGNAVFFTVTNSLLDAGPGSGSTLTATYGFNLLLKPTTGDLLGTTLRCTAPRFNAVVHTWAGEDRGTNAAGYSNNVAIGTLVLGLSDIYCQHYFQGTGAHNGLYVDVLDLRAVTSIARLQDQIAMDPSAVVYFAAAKLGFTPPPNAYGIAQEPEEYLDGQFGGHLRWVRSYAGPNSSVAVLINGQTVMVNKALRNSKIIDSNGDGLPNYYDSNPFGVPAPMLTAAIVPANPSPAKAVAISWLAAPNTVYQVEYTTNMLPANWQPLMKYTNSAATSTTVTIFDTNAPASVHRFYRLGFSP
jgi:hypothetical protein